MSAFIIVFDLILVHVTFCLILHFLIVLNRLPSHELILLSGYYWAI